MRRPTSLQLTGFQMINRSLTGLAMSLAALGILGTTVAKAEPIAKPAALPDGIYLYGQAPEPEKLNTGYFVFEVNHGNVLGALYMPSSSFDCASGTFEDSRLALKVRDSYDRSNNPYDIALERTAKVADASDATVKPLGLEGFYRIDTISPNDLRMLKVCKADLGSR